MALLKDIMERDGTVGGLTLFNFNGKENSRKGVILGINITIYLYTSQSNSALLRMTNK